MTDYRRFKITEEGREIAEILDEFSTRMALAREIRRLRLELAKELERGKEGR